MQNLSPFNFHKYIFCLSFWKFKVTSRCMNCASKKWHQHQYCCLWQMCWLLPSLFYPSSTLPSYQYTWSLEACWSGKRMWTHSGSIFQSKRLLNPEEDWYPWDLWWSSYTWWFGNWRRCSRASSNWDTLWPNTSKHHLKKVFEFVLFFTNFNFTCRNCSP